MTEDSDGPDQPHAPVRTPPPAAAPDAPTRDEAPHEAAAIAAILGVVRARCGIDFRDQLPEVIRRGIARRLCTLGLTEAPAARTAEPQPTAASLCDYLARLEGDPAEATRLTEALVVPVSAFFRDPEVWRYLEGVVLPEQAALGGAAGLRAWAAGIATGEEAWSLAILLATLAEARPYLAGRTELLATDVDERSLAVARAGRYPAGISAAVPPPFQHFVPRFFRRAGATDALVGELRPLVTFARHDLMGPTLAPPEAIIASFALVLARNLLIYFDERLRGKALERLHKVIRVGGALVLGTVEAIPEALAGKFRPYPGVPESLHVFRRED
jgi:two-component system CheB/CheR fusion protein